MQILKNRENIFYTDTFIEIVLDCCYANHIYVISLGYTKMWKLFSS